MTKLQNIDLITIYSFEPLNLQDNFHVLIKLSMPSLPPPQV